MTTLTVAVKTTEETWSQIHLFQYQDKETESSIGPDLWKEAEKNATARGKSQTAWLRADLYSYSSPTVVIDDKNNAYTDGWCLESSISWYMVFDMLGCGILEETAGIENVDWLAEPEKIESIYEAALARKDDTEYWKQCSERFKKVLDQVQAYKVETMSLLPVTYMVAGEEGDSYSHLKVWTAPNLQEGEYLVITLNGKTEYLRLNCGGQRAIKPDEQSSEDGTTPTEPTEPTTQPTTQPTTEPTTGPCTNDPDNPDYLGSGELNTTPAPETTTAPATEPETTEKATTPEPATDYVGEDTGDVENGSGIDVEFPGDTWVPENPSDGSGGYWSVGTDDGP